MEYNHIETEKKWREFWADNKTFKAEDNSEKPKFYALDMFPYPSGAGLHVGHPLGYIASDIVARYKRHKGFNVLHPMGYDSFGLPAEQYAIQTGQHPAVTTKTNIEGGTDKSGAKIAGYRKQLDIMGFSFDWDREIRTSSLDYYKGTQDIFKQIFNSWYNKATNKAEKIDTLISVFETEGNQNVNAVCDETEIFTAEEWKGFSEKQQRAILMNYRLTFLSDSWVNWCPVLGTVLANDEIKNGVSERGGHPVVQKLMRQWSMRITAYAERLLQGLDKIDWSDSIKEQQKNWIGKSKGASLQFSVEGNEEEIIEVFTTRPDTIFGVNFMVLAPELELVNKITTSEYKEKVEAYQKESSLKTERDRQANVDVISGEFTGAYAIHPFTGEKVAIWIGDYVLASYGTGAVMAVPAGDSRDWKFAKHFGIDILDIFEDHDLTEGACEDKKAILKNSDFLNGNSAKKGIGMAIKAIHEKGCGKGKTNYRLRDAIFSRQRYWGEPFPVYYKDDIPYILEGDEVVELPEVDKYLPTEDGEPPLARAKKEAWNVFEGDRMEYNTMPGWAGSSWYYLRYMDSQNKNELVSKEKSDYWNQVDLYIGGAEHAVGHLLYSRFWCKFLYDMGVISFEEPFKKLINQGMILGRSSFVYKAIISLGYKYNNVVGSNEINDIYVSKNLINNDKDWFFDQEAIQIRIKKIVQEIKKNNVDFDESSIKFTLLNVKFQPNRIDIKYVQNDILDITSAIQNPIFKYLKHVEFILEDGEYICGSEIDKMSKTYYNVQTPDELVEKFGADTLRCYEMFLGPLEQAKPWDTQGINGVNNFLRKLWRLFHQNETFTVTEGEADKKALKSLHTAIKNITSDIERYSFNTVVSNLMIVVNELSSQKCTNRNVLESLLILASPYAPHIVEELWNKLENTESISTVDWPEFNPQFLVEANHLYPVSFNGKMRFKIELPTEMGKEAIEKAVMAHEKTEHYLEGKVPKKMIVIPKKIVNIVV